jgi:protein SCO1/2
MRLIFFCCVCSGLFFSSHCSHANAVTNAAATNGLQTFQVKGLVVSLDPDGKTVKIKHEEIPGYMAAMTMDFEARGSNALANITPGDSVEFRMLVTEDDGWIEQLRKLDVPKIEPSKMPPGIRLVRDVEPLNAGDLLPEYHFTNQSGATISTLDFRGRAVALTFIFTRCPFPTFCPRVTTGFEETQTLLLTNHPSITNWHLLSLTIDPEFDTPEILKDYANRSGGKASRWTFATGTLMDLTAISEQFGLQFWREPGGLPNHNLRTVVVDAAGRVQTNLVGNTWTASQLADELLKAAAVPPTASAEAARK